MIENVHSRVIAAPPPEIERWLQRAWSGTDEDVFPRDLLSTWRKPDGAVVPGQTRFGHGPFVFRPVAWSGGRYEVAFREKDGVRGQHGFTLTPVDGGTRVTHWIRGEPLGKLRVLWPLLIEPAHDLIIEGLFDRLEVAVREGRVPARTARQPPAWLRWAFRRRH